MALFFWIGLSIAFLALATITGISERKVRAKRDPLAGMPHVNIPSPTADALRDIFIVEMVGFILAAIAALYSAFY